MTTPILHKSFKKQYKKLSKIQKQEFDLAFIRFVENPTDARLKDHELKGKFAGLRSFSVGYDLRVIYEVIDGVAVFYEIGTHAQLYKK